MGQAQVCGIWFIRRVRTPLFVTIPAARSEKVLISEHFTWEPGTTKRVLPWVMRMIKCGYLTPWQVAGDCR